MATVTLGGTPIQTIGQLPATGTKAPDFQLVAADMKRVSLNEFAGKSLILNIFPSIDTSTCATSVRQFNQLAANLRDVKVLCISRDLPYAQKRFCGAEGIENVINLSDFDKGTFGKDYGVEMLDGRLQGLHARAIVVLNATHEVIHTELVSELRDEPDYEKALSSIS